MATCDQRDVTDTWMWHHFCHILAPVTPLWSQVATCDTGHYTCDNFILWNNEGVFLPYIFFISISEYLSHRCIKPCFFVLGLDFFHFNSCGALFSPGSIKYIYFDFKSFSTKIFGKVWSQIGFFHLFAHFDGWKSIQWVIKTCFYIT